ncbi:hypothetical protein [Streptosporangium carneum]|uniref:Uncharacterized protein n=1 Tax=Streptosporangium carneum TaxID=47481 RepID=A0A9W6MFS5_9ACTN|nr:hypothetical protein [Streptosporangium carneum]GLK12370.1 hypothetical protein GCM10017600_57800 [Streptosporangium carneum]
MRNRFAAVSAAVLFTASLLVGSASPAHATPTGCTAWASGYHVYSQCTGGTGTHAAWAYGKHMNPEIGYVSYVGQPVGVGEIASVTFPGTVYRYGTSLYD